MDDGTDLVKILWLQDDLDSLLNGLVEYKGEKLWLKKITNDDCYELHRLDDITLLEVIDNHNKWCVATGAPLNHGDPRYIKRNLSNSRSIATTKPQAMGATQTFVHKITPSTVSGQLVTTITNSKFSNWSVPQRFLYI